MRERAKNREIQATNVHKSVNQISKPSHFLASYARQHRHDTVDSSKKCGVSYLHIHTACMEVAILSTHHEKWFNHVLFVVLLWY